jgi:hypothetical protein
MAVHTYHTITTTDIYPDLRGLAEILVLGYVCVQTMPLCYGWGYTYTRVPLELHPTSISYIYKRCVKGKHLQLLWMGIWLYTHTITTTGCFPKFGRVGRNAKSWCDSANKTVKSKINGMLPWQKITQPESLHMRVPYVLKSKIRLIHQGFDFSWNRHHGHYVVGRWTAGFDRSVAAGAADNMPTALPMRSWVPFDGGGEKWESLTSILGI